MRLTALESVKNAAEDLIKQASNDQDEAVQGKLLKCQIQLSRDMRFPTMWYVRPAKPQISLHICTV